MAQNEDELAAGRLFAPETLPDRIKAFREKAAAADGSIPETVDAEQTPRRIDLAESWLAKRLGPRYAPNRVRLESFELYDDRQREVIERVRALHGRLAEMTNRGHGVIFYGTVGTGKDRLLANLLYVAYARHGITCDWWDGENLWAWARELIRQNAPVDDIASKFCHLGILAISDPSPAIGELSDWQTRLLARIVDLRYRKTRPTWITLNALDIGELYELLSDRVADRLKEDAEIFPCFWQSYREWKNIRRPG